MTRALVAAIALAGCFKPLPQEGFACGPDGWCPDPLRCANDHTCRGGDVTGDSGIVHPDGDPTKANVAFVASTTLTAIGLGPPATADVTCTQIANGASHPGTFVAWTSTAQSSVRDRLGSARGWVRTDDRPFADSVDDLLAGKIFYPLRKDEHVADHVGPVMTGTNPDGASNMDDCAAFTSGNMNDLIALGASDGGTVRWTGDSEDVCSQHYGFYCLEIDHERAVTVSPETGPRAFVTVAPFTPTAGGLGQADILCAQEAVTAQLNGQFLAFLSTSQAAAITRFAPLSGLPWVRIDGVSTTADFITWDAPIDVASDRSYQDADVFSGSTAPALKSLAGESCNDWTSTSGFARVGDAGRASAAAFGVRSAGCAPHPIFCLEKQ